MAETTYDIVRNYRLIAYLANTETDFWKILATYFAMEHLPIPDEREFSKLNEKEILDKYKALTDQKIIQSYPDWIFF